MTKLDREGAAALAAAARAFRKAQNKGYVWIGEQGAFETHESTGAWTPPPLIHPNQLRLA